MKEYSYLLVFIILSCNQVTNKEKSNQIEIKESQILTSDSLSKRLGCQLEDYVNSNSMVTIHEEYIQNPHSSLLEEESVYDSSIIRTVKINGSLFKQYLYGEDEQILVYAHLNEKNITLSSTIQIGMKKQDLSEFLNTEIIADTFTVRNEMDNYFFIFVFQGDELHHLFFEAYPD